MRFEINNWRKSDKEIPYKQVVTMERKYLRHLLNLELPKNSCILKYFSKPFFHDAILTKFELSTLNHCVGIEIVRADAETEDINNFLKRNRLPTIDTKSYLKNPVIYRFDFYGIKNCILNFDHDENIDSFRIMDCELDKNRNGMLLTISQDIGTEMKFNFKSVKFTFLNKNALEDHSKGRLKRIPHCKECQGKLMTMKKIEKVITTNCLGIIFKM